MRLEQHVSPPASPLKSTFSGLSATSVFQRLDKPGWKKFLSAIAALGMGFFFAIYSNVAAQQGHIGLTALCASIALLLSGYVAITAVPYLARRTSLEWLRVSIDYQLTRQGMVFIVIIFLLAIAGMNTGNNLLYLVVASLLAAILMSGVMSLAVLTSLELEIILPEHVFARRAVPARIRLENAKKLLPSFSITVAGSAPAPEAGQTNRSKRKHKDAAASAARDDRPSGILRHPNYFPFIPARRTLERKVMIQFPRRGIYGEKGFSLSTRFPFGFLEKKIEIEASRELVVYPSVQPSSELFEIMPTLSGEVEAFLRGRGNDLYSIREMLPTDSARHLDWKASARTGTLKVREFAREDERRLQLVFDRRMGPLDSGALERFETAVEFCASVAWHFHQMDAQLQFTCEEFHTPAARGAEIIYDILAFLAAVKPSPERPLGAPVVAPAQDVFRIIFTGAPHGSVPAREWGRAYFVFVDALRPEFPRPAEL
ncbi:MAG: DUF58 domain-containing protein [Acidobacteria bacterium]|nr:DUF58 domain-containing protein [Acidobacteriota bacterium]